MFNSGISAHELVDRLDSEVDIAIDIPRDYYLRWINSLEQLLYSEFIKEQKAVEFETNNITSFVVAELDVGDDENAIRFEDIRTVYADGVELIKTTATGYERFEKCYYKDGDSIVIRPKSQTVKIIYYVKPALKKISNDAIIGNIMLPIEFIEIVSAKLRGEAYKIANEDVLAAKWLNDYNVLLENFAVWLGKKAPDFGR